MPLHQIPITYGWVKPFPESGGSNQFRNIWAPIAHWVSQMISGIGGSNHSRNTRVKPFPEWWVRGIRNIQKYGYLVLKSYYDREQALNNYFSIQRLEFFLFE